MGGKKNEQVSDVQKDVIRYFWYTKIIGEVNLSLGKVLSDTEYDNLVRCQVSIDDVKSRAIENLGLDESELTEIEPVHFENYYFGDGDDNWIFFYTKARKTGGSAAMFFGEKILRKNAHKIGIMFGEGKDGKWRSSAYQVTWLFSTQKQVCIYQETIYLHKNETNELTKQYLWKHITSIASARTNLKVKTKGGSKASKIDEFQLTVAGDTFACSMTPTDYTTKAINAMKQRLLEFS